MKPSINYVLILMLLCLSSCTVGPDFIRPPAPASEAYTLEKHLDHFGTQVISPQKSLSASWWEEFCSPDLNGVILKGIKHNYTLASLQETLMQAKELSNAASGELFPELSLNTLAGRQKYGVALFGPTNLQVPPFTYYEIGPSLTYPLDLFGGTRRTIEKQQALVRYQAHLFHAASLSLTGNIALTSFTIAGINAQIETLKEIIQDDQQNLHLIQNAFQLGGATQTDILSAKNQLITDQTLLPGLYQQLSQAQDALNVLVGSMPAIWQPPAFQLKNFKLPLTLPLRLPSTLVRTRPDILAAEDLLHTASADIGIATANLYPTLTLSASTLQEALIPAQLFTASANAWSYLGNITTPLFNGGGLRAQKRAAIHAYQAAYANYQQVVLKALVQVTDVLHALKQDAQAEQLQKKAVKTAKSALTLARLNYKTGGTNVLEMLEAQRTYRQARLAYVKVKTQRYQDTAQFYLSLGGIPPQ